MNEYFNNFGTGTVRNPATGKLHRISVRRGVPYITYKRKTRVLFKGPLGLGACINVGADVIYFRDAINPSLHANG